ncbi:MAG TPA: hydroxymethylglutaryl-CoA lyase [Acidobacteriaceae bacterium]
MGELVQMGGVVKIVECPRDAWQGLPVHIPAEIKAAYLEKLIKSGFRHIDAVSFVSPKAVPQMADSEDVLNFLAASETASEDVEIIGVVVNVRGAERAIAAERVSTLGFPYSISPTFLERNQRQTPEEALDTLEEIGTQAYQAGIETIAYMSMAFGNPYGDAWSVDEVIAGCELLVDSGMRQIVLADTVGVAGAEQIGETVAEVMQALDGIEIGVHLHARPDGAAEKIRAAYEASCRRFDAAVGGLGGCPFAQDVLVGNIATETLVSTLRGLGARVPELPGLEDLQIISAGMSARYSGA